MQVGLRCSQESGVPRSLVLNGRGHGMTTADAANRIALVTLVEQGV